MYGLEEWFLNFLQRKRHIKTLSEKKLNSEVGYHYLNNFFVGALRGCHRDSNISGGCFAKFDCIFCGSWAGGIKGEPVADIYDGNEKSNLPFSLRELAAGQEVL